MLKKALAHALVYVGIAMASAPAHAEVIWGWNFDAASAHQSVSPTQRIFGGITLFNNASSTDNLRIDMYGVNYAVFEGSPYFDYVINLGTDTTHPWDGFSYTTRNLFSVGLAPGEQFHFVLFNMMPGVPAINGNYQIEALLRQRDGDTIRQSMHWVVQDVPEPATLPLLTGAALLLAAQRLRRARSS